MPRHSDSEEIGSVVGSGLHVDPVKLEGTLTSMRKDLEYLIREIDGMQGTLKEVVREQKIANGRTKHLEAGLESHSHGGTERRLRDLEDHDLTVSVERSTTLRTVGLLFNSRLAPWILALLGAAWLATDSPRGPF